MGGNERQVRVGGHQERVGARFESEHGSLSGAETFGDASHFKRVGGDNAGEAELLLNGQLDRLRRLSLPEPGYVGQMVAEHRDVVAAIADRDVDRAEAALRHHLRMVLSQLPALQRERPEFFEDARA